MKLVTAVTLEFVRVMGPNQGVLIPDAKDAHANIHALPDRARLLLEVCGEAPDREVTSEEAKAFSTLARFSNIISD